LLIENSEVKVYRKTVAAEISAPNYPACFEG
jgi:hypothetical protein